jgi:gliding motility-associated lipoprotein GldH
MTNKLALQIAGSIIAVAIIATACSNNRVYDRFESIPGASWNYNKPLEFKVDMQDTTQVYDIYLNLRHKSLYSMSNLFMFVTTQSPSGDMVKDTVEFILADPSGKWLGNGLGDLLTYRRIYKRNIRFAQKGTYIFRLQQAMRVNDLPHITDAGVCIEKVTK